MNRMIVAISVLVVVLGGTALYRAQQSAPVPEQPRSDDELPRPELRFTGLPAPTEWDPARDPESWSALGPDIGIRLYRDSFGNPRGRVYVRRNERWMALAIDGLSDIGAPTRPAR